MENIAFAFIAIPTYIKLGETWQTSNHETWYSSKNYHC